MISTAKRICKRWLLLPTTVLSAVFGCLLPKEVYNQCRMVCRQWRCTKVGWTNVTLYNTIWKTDAVLAVCQPLLMRSVVLCGIHPLSPAYDSNADENVARLVAFSALEALTVKDFHLTNLGLRHLVVLNGLKSLSLTGADYFQKITDKGLRYICRLSLEHLTLDRCDEVTYKGFRHLSTLRNLLSLELGHCPQLTSEALKHLSSCLKLQSLRLNKCNCITSEGLQECLQSWHTLRELRQAYFDIRDIDDGCLRELSFFDLRTLDLVGCRCVSDEGLRCISDVVRLEELRLEICTKVSDEGLRHLSRLLSLKKLRLGYCPKVTEKGWRHVSGLSLHTLEC